MACGDQTVHVANCSLCPGSTATFLETFWKDKTSNCEELPGSDAACECLRPYFPSSTTSGDDPCVNIAAFINVGLISPLLAFEIVFLLYNIVYAIWIVRLKGGCGGLGSTRRSTKRSNNSCCGCNYIIAGACLVIAKEVIRLAWGTLDPYNIVEAVPDRIGFFLMDLSWALLQLIMCMVVLSFAKAVHAQNRVQTTDASEDKSAKNWAPLAIIIFTAAGTAFSVTREFIVVIYRRSGGKNSNSLYNVFNYINSAFFLIFILLMTIYARILQLRLRAFSKTFQKKSHAQAIILIDTLMKNINRYFYPSMGGGFLILITFAVFTICLGDLNHWSNFFSWVLINVLHSTVTLLVLFNLEGKLVPAFPRQVLSCRSCSKKSELKQDNEKTKLAKVEVSTKQ